MNSLLADVHLPYAVVESLRKLGMDVLTAQEDGSGRAPDEELLHRAAQMDRILLTQDKDFLSIAADWLRIGREFPAIIYIRQGTPLGGVINDIELLIVCSAEAELRNRVYYLPLR